MNPETESPRGGKGDSPHLPERPEGCCAQMRTVPFSSRMPPRVLTILACGLLATWLAAGSFGWIVPPLARSLTWLALGAVALLAIYGGESTRGGRRLLAAAGLIALLMTVSSLAVINIMAVALLMAAAAHACPGMTTRAAGPVALAAAALAVFRTICEGTAAGWAVANGIGQAVGVFASFATRRPLAIGASFGGVDFLVAMAVLLVAWRQAAPAAAAKRLLPAVLAVAAAQTAYLVVLAFSHDLAGLLPPYVRPVFDEKAISHVGVWTWSNALHGLLPWHLPVLAAVLQCIVAVVIFRLTPWPMLPQKAPAEVSETGGKRGRDRRRAAATASPVPAIKGRAGWRDFVPAGLLFFSTVALALAPVKPDLAGRKIVAYDNGTLDWTTADPGNFPAGTVHRYGLLPALVASLGGDFVISKDLSDGDLHDASVVLVLRSKVAGTGHPRSGVPSAGVLPDEIRQKIWTFVRAGGSLLVTGGPENPPSAGQSALNSLLASTAISFRYDAANSLTERWEDDLLAAPSAANATGPPRSKHVQPRSRGKRPHRLAGRSIDDWPLVLGSAGKRSSAA